MARQMMDLGIDSSYELVIAMGDFRITESTSAHQIALIFDNKGDYKETPTLCIGANNYIDDEGRQGIVRAISQEFMKDGMEVINMVPNPESIGSNMVKVFEYAYYK